MSRPGFLTVPESAAALALMRPRAYRRLAVASWLRWMIQVGAMLVVFPLMVGRLGTEDFGLWAALTAPTSMAPLLGFGISPAILSLLGRVLGEARGAVDAPAAALRIRALAATAAAGWWLSVLAGIFTLVAGLLAADVLVDFLRVPASQAADGVFLFRASTTCLAAMIVGSGMTAMLEGLGRFDLSSLSGGTVAVANAVFLLIAVMVSPTFFGLGIVSFATAALNLVVPLVLITWRRWLWLLGGVRPSRKAFTDVARLAVGLGGASALGALADPLIKWSIAALAGGVPVASYELANRVVSIIGGSLSALFGPLSPHAARVSTEGGLAEMSRVVVGIARRVNGVAIPTLAAVAGMSGAVLSVWLGGNVPEGASRTLVLLSVAAIASFPGRPAWASLVARGHGGSLVLVQLTTLSLVALVLALTAGGLVSADLAPGLAILAGSVAGLLVAFATYSRHMGPGSLRALAFAALPGLALGALAAPWALVVSMLGAGDIVQIIANCSGLAMALVLGVRVLGIPLPSVGRRIAARLPRRPS